MTMTAPETGAAPKSQAQTRTSNLPTPPSPWRRTTRSLATFVKRSPMSAFWGLVALAIVLTAVAAPVLAPYDPLKSNFRRRFDSNQFEVFGGAECVHFRGISNGIDDVMLVVFDLR